MFYKIIKIVSYMGSHRVRNHWMYQDFVLLLAWWWLVVAVTCCQIFNFADLIHVVSLGVINCYIITAHNGMAPIKTEFLDEQLPASLLCRI